MFYIQSIHLLLANDYSSTYAEIRSAFEANGVDVYILGEQGAWNPPARYDARLNGNVDAMTYSNMMRTNWYDRYYFIEQILYQNYTYAKDWWLTEWNAEFIPKISPSYTPRIVDPGLTDYYEFAKNEERYSSLCNIARYTAGESRLVLIDSFNDWNYNSQVEPSEEIGEEYLNLLSSEFKL